LKRDWHHWIALAFVSHPTFVMSAVHDFPLPGSMVMV